MEHHPAPRNQRGTASCSSSRKKRRRSSVVDARAMSSWSFDLAQELRREVAHGKELDTFEICKFVVGRRSASRIRRGMIRRFRRARRAVVVGAVHAPTSRNFNDGSILLLEVAQSISLDTVAICKIGMGRSVNSRNRRETNRRSFRGGVDAYRCHREAKTSKSFTRRPPDHWRRPITESQRTIFTVSWPRADASARKLNE